MHNTIGAKASACRHVNAATVTSCASSTLAMTPCTSDQCEMMYRGNQDFDGLTGTLNDGERVVLCEGSRPTNHRLPLVHMSTYLTQLPEYRSHDGCESFTPSLEPEQQQPLHESFQPLEEGKASLEDPLPAEGTLRIMQSSSGLFGNNSTTFWPVPIVHDIHLSIIPEHSVSVSEPPADNLESDRARNFLDCIKSSTFATDPEPCHRHQFSPPSSAVIHCTDPHPFNDVVSRPSVYFS